MKRWPIKPLSELCDVEGGNAAPQGDENFKDGTLPFVRMKDLGRYHFTNNLRETSDKLTEASVAKSRMKTFEPGCILFPRSGSVALNHRAILGIRACIVSHIGVLQNLKPEISPGFLYLYLTTFDMTALSKKTTGVDSIAFADVKKIPVPVPPLAEQERIVRLLDEADELRKLRAQADRHTDALIAASFHEMFGDPDINPKGWRVVKVGDVVHPIEFGISEALSKGCEYQPGRIAVLRIANITAEGTVDYDDLRYLKVSDRKQNQLLLHKGDLLFNWRNSPKWVGKTAVFDSDKPCIFASFLYRLRVVEDAVDQLFLWFYFNHLRRNGFFESRCRQAVSQANFGRDELADVRIILPPLPLQKEFAQRVTEICELEAGQATSRSRLDALFQSMLHRAFNGEL